MAKKKPTLKKLKAFPDDSSIILDAPELEWLKDALGEHDPGYQAYVRVNQIRIDNYNISKMIDILKARGKL